MSIQTNPWLWKVSGLTCFVSGSEFIHPDKQSSTTPFLHHKTTLTLNTSPTSKRYQLVADGFKEDPEDRAEFTAT